jgi:hypothetical protein
MTESVVFVTEIGYVCGESEKWLYSGCILNLEHLRIPNK